MQTDVKMKKCINEQQQRQIVFFPELANYSICVGSGGGGCRRPWPVLVFSVSLISCLRGKSLDGSWPSESLTVWTHT